jgi:transcriptional regulator with XRE-family HTH domain
VLDIVDPSRPQDPPWRSRHAHRNLDPAVAELLARRRQQLGWSKSEAERQTGVSRRMITLLERGERVPSTVLADDLAEGYGLPPADSFLLSSVALPNVGRDSPFRTGQPDRHNAL